MHDKIPLYKCRSEELGVASLRRITTYIMRSQKGEEFFQVCRSPSAYITPGLFLFPFVQCIPSLITLVWSPPSFITPCMVATISYYPLHDAHHLLLPPTLSYYLFHDTWLALNNCCLRHFIGSYLSFCCSSWDTRCNTIQTQLALFFQPPTDLHRLTQLFPSTTYSSCKLGLVLLCLVCFSIAIPTC